LQPRHVLCMCVMHEHVAAGGGVEVFEAHCHET
jgi:hypothetical protein